MWSDPSDRVHAREEAAMRLGLPSSDVAQARARRYPMAIVRRDPFWFDLPDLWRRFFSFDLPTEGWLRVEELRDKNDLVVRAELPGIDPDRDVEVTVSEGVLHISARREERSEQKENDTVRSEFHYGSFVRNLPLPSGVREDDVDATYKDGILEIRMPIGEEQKAAAKRIPVSRPEPAHYT
jgi:HSP20 family protein